MDTNAESSIPRDRKIIALIVLLIMLGATLAASLAFYEPPEIREKFEEKGFVLRARKNVQVTTVPEPNNEPAIAVDPNDPMHIVAAGNDYSQPNKDAWVGYYVSWDGGETWERDLIPGYREDDILSPLSLFKAAGDPVVCFDSDSNVFISGICFKRPTNPANPITGWTPGPDDGIFVAKSTDGGKTFNQINILAAAMQAPISFHDKEWMAVDMNNGNVYVVWVVFTLYSLATVLFSRSTDNGNSYSLPPMVISEYQALEVGSQGSTIQVTPDGRVHISWIDFNQGQVRYTYSTNEGQSFSTPQSIADVNPIPYALENGDYRTPTLLMSAVDLSDTNTSGYLYITWNDYRYGDADILLIYSWDNGQTWSEPVRVNNDEEGNGHDQFFSAVAVSPQGWVHMVFYDRRDDENNTLIWAYYAISKNGGENFTVNMNMSDESFDGNNAPHPFIGDYIGICATNTAAYAVWCDTRDGTPESGSSEIYFGAVDFSDGSEEQPSEDGTE
ncbi:MAG: exo-alpha-sialidase [Thermoplasmata archaeon]|nr:MAG: exo-alpha-sialidase [Thermoplasmata archaeon]